MKKILHVTVLILMSLSLTSAVFARSKSKFYNPGSKTFYHGVNIIDAGVGFGWYGGTSGLDMKIPPMVVSYERGVFIKGLPLSFGAIFGVAQYGKEYTIPMSTDSYELTSTSYVFGGRAAWHFDLKVKGLDLYAGFSLGVYYAKAEVNNSTYGNTAASGSDFYGGIFGGARYFFTDVIGAFAEVGYDIGYFKFGVAAKF